MQARCPKQLTISDFSPIPVDCSHCLALHVFFSFNAETHIVSSLLLEFVNECLPYLPTFNVGKVRIVDFDMDTRDECVVEAAYPVRREEENAVVEFERAQEACCDGDRR